jgi:hypothetical protein
MQRLAQGSNVNRAVKMPNAKRFGRLQSQWLRRVVIVWSETGTGSQVSSNGWNARVLMQSKPGVLYRKGL